MIDELDRSLADWVRTIAGPVRVLLAPPSDPPEGQGVHLFLVDLWPDPSTRTANPPLQIMTRYLVTTWAETAEAAHRLLGKLLFAALAPESAGRPELEVEREPVALAFWQALGQTPRPAFCLRAPLRLEREPPRRHRVRLPLVLRTQALASLHGLLVGPGETPIAGALVDLPAHSQAVRTDHQGRFHFTGLLGLSGPVQVRVRAKGLEETQLLDLAGSPESPVIVRLHDLEA